MTSTLPLLGIDLKQYRNPPKTRNNETNVTVHMKLLLL
jgi:hypothetical protein